MTEPFQRKPAIIEAMTLLLDRPYDTKATDFGDVAVFPGTNVSIHDFIDWVAVQRKTAGEFIDRNPGLTRQHIRDYLFSALPDRFLPYGERRDWAPNHARTT